MEANPTKHPLFPGNQQKDRKSFSPSVFSGIQIDQGLFCPGPVNVSNEVKEALLHPDIGHREVEFTTLLKRIRQKLSTVFGVRNFLKYTSVVINGSGSAANEAVLSSIGRDTKVLVLANGEFGDRLIELSEYYQETVNSLQLNWGESFRTDAIERALDEYKPDLVAMVHHETSTGMLNPISLVGKMCRARKIQLFVDTVSSLAAETVDVEKNHITYCTSSSNKAIASVCGLSFVCGRVSAFESLRDVRRQTRYLDLYRHYKYETDLNQTPNTPSLTVYFALDAALNQILRVGLPERMAKIERKARLLRSEIAKMGLEAIVPEDKMSRVLTTFRLPDHISYDYLRDALKDRGFVIYGGKGPLENKVFQVANIGEIDKRSIQKFIKALRESLAQA